MHTDVILGNFMGLFPVVEITLESNSSWTQTLNCYGGIDVLNNNSSKQTVIKINNHYDVFAVTHTQTHMHVHRTGQALPLNLWQIQ